ncbi:hypothetical protein TWF281_010938 [Arthrobotrys megalospora]
MTRMKLPVELSENQNLQLLGKLYSWTLEEDMKYCDVVKNMKEYDAGEDDHIF